MSSKKLFLLVFLLLNSVIGCASPVPVATLAPAIATLPPSPTTEPSSVSESAIHCSFANLTDPENHPCSVEQLESILGFDIKKTTLDDSQLVFIKAYWNRPTTDSYAPDIAGLFYQCPANECNMFVTKIPLVSADKSNIIDWGKTPSSAIETVQLKEGTGEYVKGWFYQAEPGQPEVWSSDLEIQRLMWINNDVLFTVALDGNSSAVSMGKEELIGFANSMK